MTDDEPPRRGRRALGIILAVLVLVGVVSAPFVLHFGLRRHARLPFDVVAAFPPERPLVGGEAYATTVAELVEHELHDATGWRPNDFFLWSPRLWADNNANRQLGIIQAVRESVRVLKNDLTKVSSDQYDPNLVAADTALRNDELKLWLPSAESRFAEGAERLRAYVAGLGTDPPQSKPLNQRNVELIHLFEEWSDLLGGAHASLYRADVGFTESDDLFYRAQGFAHVMHHLMLAIRREYAHELAARPVLRTLATEVADALGRAAAMKPFIVLDGEPDGLFANHRRNLDAYITEARQKLYSLREELEK